ncbi:MAG: glutamate racemase, partial [Alphaproteobacteria bacterium]|nr:glutamate racemase [Alphaproteobacteria bacterium]
MSARPTILIFDSGVGGLTVLDPVRAARPDARYIYLGDTAFFPYGERDEDELIARVVSVIDDAVARFK